MMAASLGSTITTPTSEACRPRVGSGGGRYCGGACISFANVQIDKVVVAPFPVVYYCPKLTCGKSKKRQSTSAKNGAGPRSRGVCQPAAQVPPRPSASNASVTNCCCHPDCALTATFASCKALLAAHPLWGAASSAPQAGETSAEARPRAWHPTARVHPSAIVDPRAVLDRDACVGPLCVLGPGAVFFFVVHCTRDAHAGKHAYVHAWGNSCAQLCMCVFKNICTDARVRKQVLGHRTLLESHVVISGNVILADGVVVLLCLCLHLLLRLLQSFSDSMSGVLMHMHPLTL